ncbi:MAG: N-acetylneuraminate synthase family protein [Alphaproteobacteria bacterium]|nr:N-acetylneuraminate synthase family protein [Alphaproteobacteria bacterium]
MKIGAHDLAEAIFVVAEIGNNHEGSFARAEEMIGRAKAAGANAVKFQTIVPEKLVSATDTARIAQLRRFQFSYKQFEALAATARREGITFLSTPFDIASVAALDPLVPAFKIASGDNDFDPLLEAVAATGKPILLSTGLCDIDAVERSKCVIEAAWRRAGRGGALALLHCVVSYPTAPADATLLAIRELATLGCTVGYSDHTIGITAAVLSVALGARIIEKHFTLDKNQSDFHDHKLSADPADLAEMVGRVREAELLLGGGGKRVLPCEAAVLARVRRGIAAARDLPRGTIVSASDLTWVRPRAGLAPGEEAQLIGRRLAIAVPFGAAILPEHFA